jgi:hypothetical protein
MLLDGKIDDDPDTSYPNQPSKAWSIGAGLCLLPIYILFSAFGVPGKGNAAICFGGALIMVVRLRWNLRNRIWFWVTVSFLALLHAARVFLIPWPNKNYTLPILLPVGILDALAISYSIQLVAKKKEPLGSDLDASD